MNAHEWGLEWSDDLSVGMSEIDQNHQRFITLIGDLNLAIVDRKELAEIRNRLQLLFDYAEQEFSSEDELLRHLDYPDVESHVREHEAIIKEFNTALRGFDENTLMYPWIEAGLKMKARLINHFLNEDMKFRDFCRSRPR
jgi:hemerythrin